MTSEPGDSPAKEREERILDAVIRLLGRQGIAGLSIRAVAREAGVALGLVNYYYRDKHGLICAALRHVEDQDMALVEPDASRSPEEQLREALGRIADPDFLTTEYLSLRLQLWSLAQIHEDFSRINTSAQSRYRAQLARLIQAAVPHLSADECAQRAADVDVIQNGLWLTTLLGLDETAIRRAMAHCEEIALGT